MLHQVDVCAILNELTYCKRGRVFMCGFDDIIGNDGLKSYFSNAIETKTVSHSYILSGEEGVGKKMFAKAFAMAMQCTCEGKKPCGECHSCKQALSNNHPDIIYVSHEKPQTLGVDDIRKGLVEDIVIRPYSGPYKIYIVDEAEKMSIQAQNAMLKTIEEPPEYGIVLLLTTNASAFLPTILSRCMVLQVKPVTLQQEEDYLRVHGIPNNQMESLLHFTRGNIGKAIRMASSEYFSSMIFLVTNLLKSGSSMGLEQTMLTIEQLESCKVDIYDCLDFMQMWYRDVLLFKATADINQIMFRHAYSDIKRVASKCGYDGIQKILDAIDVARRRLDANVNFELTIELLLQVMHDQNA